MSALGHRQTGSVSQNHKAQLASAYNELGKELSSHKIRVVGNYTLGKVIGEGAYGKVRMGTHRLTGIRVAIKQIPKAMSAALTREIHHHRQLHHPHVTQLFEVIATENNIWLVTELCSGGELFDYLAEKGRLDEDETRIFFGQLCLAVAYVHEKGIVHRDLKLENVLLDERCRVKLGDFGFTREFERGVLLETFCGTTGYASPEMLQCEKYLGPEVDVWSLGIILYTLLTGTLPFDDDDEAAMKEKVIKGIYEDPEWLSDDARDLIKNILQVDPSQRLTIAQILAHPWFKLSHTAAAAEPIVPAADSRQASRSASPTLVSSPSLVAPQVSSGASEASFHSASSECAPSTPSTADEPAVDVVSSDDHHMVHRNPSEATLRRAALARLESNIKMSKVHEEEPSDAEIGSDAIPMRPSLSRTTTTSQGSNKAPPAFPTRTPVRTKRRSVSSTLSDHLPLDKSSFPTLQDFSSILNTPAPLIFSTPLERELLNSLSMLGFDTGQIVHSVLADACDATGALWWMLKRRTERKLVESGSLQSQLSEVHADDQAPPQNGERPHASARSSQDERVAALPVPVLVAAHSAPELAFIPATPTAPSTMRTITPPRAVSPTNPMLSPTSATPSEASKSHPSTPSGSMKDKDGSKSRKGRSGSVSIMQRATTALEAAGLVRKKSAEGVRDDKDKDKDKDKHSERRVTSGDDTRSSGSIKLLKSPSLKPLKDGPSTPPASLDANSLSSLAGSPWVMAGGSRHSPPATPSNSPGDSLGSLPTIGEHGKIPHGRNRASLLSTFRLWFKEDAKGKRKAPPPALDAQSLAYPQPNVGSPGTSPIAGRSRGTMKRRSSNSRPSVIVGTRKGNRAKRASVSSRRSSSVNSRRSSITSTQIGFEPSSSYGMEQMVPVSRQRSDPSRRSFGSRTPNSERDEFISRPSSVHSFIAQQRHRKSPSASSSGSMYPGRTSSPLPRLHRRGGSGSSTRVVRQIPQMVPYKQSHLRSNSTSSNHSLASSRHGSLYELSESEGLRTGSPTKYINRALQDDTPRRSGPSTFLAQKRTTPFGIPGGSSYLHSIGRTSWKKSWGREPPGWQTRTAQTPTVEVLAVYPATPAIGIRDVFTGNTGRQSMGDDSDWVDEDDDMTGYAGGLGQMPSSASSSHTTPDSPMLSSMSMRSRAAQVPPPKMGNSLTVSTGSRSGRASRRSPMGRNSPLPPQPESPFDTPIEQPSSRGGRRGQLPNSNSGTAWRHPIQEEDEEE